MKQTEVRIVEKLSTNQQTYPQLERAAALIQEGEVVAFPTETVYGLGANALSAKAVRKIYRAKGRPSDNPLIVHISSVDMLGTLVDAIPKSAQKLMDVFWPGPLTIVFPKQANVPDCVTGGLRTVGIRMPNHPIALDLIRQAKVPIAAPSANISGRPSPTTVRHVIEDMNERIPLIIDGGDTQVGLESTVIDCSRSVPIILRPGKITKEEIEAILGQTIHEVMDHSGSDILAPCAPGMKYRHYVPQAEVKLVAHSEKLVQEAIWQQKKAGKSVGVLSTNEICQTVQAADRVFSLGAAGDLTMCSQRLYDGLRNFDDYRIDVILVTTVEETGVGKAIMNRLAKASEEVSDLL